MIESVRTRFAPSPTGDLHLGNLRVAVFNFLFARRHNGAFVVRLEDTDPERNRPGAEARILEDLAWAGLDWDEGPDRGGPFRPYRQSERAQLHRDGALVLLERGEAYRCSCSEEVVEAVRTEDRRTPACPGGCRERGMGETPEAMGEYAVRFKVPDAPVSVKDEVRGDIAFHGRDIGDFIILRADGRATYNFAVVADDVAMEISHVIRGAGHLSNTPKQALLFDAIAGRRPRFAHLPTVLSPEGGKLSKRTGAPGIEELRREGFHPDSVVNYLSLLGWSPGDDREVLTREELIGEMDLERAGASDTAFDPEKMRWLSAQHIATMPEGELSEAVAPYVDRRRFPELSAAELRRSVSAIRTRMSTFGEINEHLGLIFADAESLEEGRRSIAEEEEGAQDVLGAVQRTLEGLSEWTTETTAEAVREAGERVGARGRALFHPVRLAVTGTRKGPELGMTLAALGRERTLALVREALLRLEPTG